MPKKRWSTKDLVIIEPPTAVKTGTAIFQFTDDYSVFHYSKMPDRIPGKGEVLARMATATMTMLAQEGVPTHFRGSGAPNEMRVSLLRVIDPAEQELQPTDRCRLVPLQVICRNMLPEGASVFRRLARGKTTLEALGLERRPTPGEQLSSPLIEFTTKLEEIDRFVTPQEAQRLAGLSDEHFARVKELTLTINSIVTRHAASVGLLHADSKVEFGIDDEGQIILVDTAGTTDENRFLRRGRHVSKQILRDYYLPMGLEEEIQGWVEEKRPRSTWPSPPPLPAQLIEEVSELFKALAERWTGRKFWGVDDLDTLIDRQQHFAASSR